MGIVFNNSKTKIKFSSGLTFLFCEAIITQLFGCVNRRKKFFYTHLHNQLHYHLQMQKQPHLHWYNHIHIRIHLHAVWRFYVYLLMNWWVDISALVICLYVHTSINTSLTHPHIHRILHMGQFMGLWADWAICIYPPKSIPLALNPFTYSFI